MKKRLTHLEKKLMRATKKNKQNKNIAGKMFFSRNKLVFFNVILSTDFFFSKIGNNPMRTLGRKKICFFW